MGIIHKLSSHEAQKIAAGEVVERPHNIVKELLENALDAKATQITLYIQDGGKQLIRCIDNGCGMAEDDAFMSIEPHATSKLTTVDDLETIKTFGFRGEALSSISSISNFTLATQMHDADHGIQLALEFGTLVKKEIISRSPGTDITIVDIFSNIPVRKKFLKTRETEWRAIFTLVQAVALAHPQVAFTVYHDKQQILTTYATDSLTERVAQIFDAPFSQNFLAIGSDSKNNISISGGITNYQYQRYDRNQQFFFVNNRWVKNYKLGQAFTKGFQGIMPPGKHPAGIIFITVPQHEVDINVHPRKEEVVFLHPRLVEVALEAMVRERLEKESLSSVIVPQARFGEPYEYSTQSAAPYVPVERAVYPVVNNASGFSAMRSMSPPVTSTPQVTSNLSFVSQGVEQTRAEVDTQNYTVIGQLLKTYLLLETSEGLLIIDQHAAHESVLYEQFSNTNSEVVRCQLLFPEIVPVVPEDQKILLSLIPQLNKIGVHIESAGESAIAVTETPLHIKNYNLKDLIHDLLNWLQESPALDTEVWNSKISKKVFAMMACKAAVKAGDELTTLEIEELLKSLYKTEHRLTCPHGRPTTWRITQYELEKTFKRKL